MRPLALIAIVAACAQEPPSAPEIASPAAGYATGTDVSVIDAAALTSVLTAPGPKPRVVNFWATWCGPCVAELPAIESFAAAHPEVEVVLVNTDIPLMRTTKVKAFLRDRGMKTPHNVAVDVSDQRGMLVATVPDWPDQVPLTLVVATDGTEKARFNTSVDEAILASAVGDL